MAEEKIGNSQETPPVGQQVQTPTAPAAPEGTPAPGQQEGTPGEVGREEKPKSEEFFQTKYQQLVESGKEMVAKLDQYEQQFGPLPESGDQPSQTPGQPETSAPDLDPYDADSMKAYLDHNMNQIRVQLAKVAKDAIVQARQEETYNTQVQQAFGGFKKWCAENKVPQELTVEAAQAYHDNWGTAGKPSAAVEWMHDYIVKRSEFDKSNQSAVDAAKAAAEKGKDLDTVQVPAQGAPPSPELQPGKTDVEKEADKIAPDDVYVYPGN